MEDTLTMVGLENEEELQVLEWQTEQLHRLGIPRLLAEAFAGEADWHDVANLVRRGCPALLAFDIAR